MISILLTINNYNENLNNSISSIFSQYFNEIELFCLTKSSKKLNLSEEAHNNEITIIDNYNEFLTQSTGEYLLFLDSNQKIGDGTIKKLLNKSKECDLDLLITVNENEKIYGSKNLNKTFTNLEIDPKFLFKILDKNLSLFINKTFLKDNEISVFEDNSLFLLNCINHSNKFLFSNEMSITDLSDSENNKNQLNINEYYELINKILANKELYNHFKREFWKYVFGKIFEIVYYLRNETIKRKYFKESKILFNEFCFEKEYYNDIFDSVDIIVLEFFKQTLMDVCYIPEKRETGQNLINENFKKVKIAIKSTRENNTFEENLIKRLKKKGFKVILHQKENWDDKKYNEDIALVLRTDEKYTPKDDCINLIWNIYDDDRVSIYEYNLFDFVFVSSKEYMKSLEKKIESPIKQLKYEDNYENKKGKIKEIGEDIIETLRNITF